MLLHKMHTTLARQGPARAYMLVHSPCLHVRLARHLNDCALPHAPSKLLS